MEKKKVKAKGDVAVRKISKTKTFYIPEAESQKIIERAMDNNWLLWIKTSAWGNRKKLADELLEEKFQDDADAISAVVKLIDSSYVKAVTSPMGRAQTAARSRALPWFHEGIYFILEKDREDLDTIIEECEEEVRQNKEVLVAEYPSLRREAIKKHPNVVKEEYFPSTDRLKQKFNLAHGWQKIALPMSSNGKISVVSKDFAERENNKYKELMMANAEEAVVMVRKTFLTIATRLRDALVDPNAKFKDVTVEKPKEFLKQFKDINIFEDKPFEKIVEDLTDILDGVYGKDLRDDAVYRKEMGGIMDDVVKEFEQLPIVKYKREIEF